MTVPLLSITGAVADGVRTVRVSGDIDMATADQLRVALTAATGEPLVVVDLTDVGFLDATGISALVAGRHAIHAAGGSVRVTGAHGIVRKILQLTGLLEPAPP